MSEWRSVSDPPEDGQDVLLWMEDTTGQDYIMGAFYCDEDWIPDDKGFWAYISSVTQNYVEPKYWMPLPEPPE